ncbi:MAG TPA: DinB family protein [Terriglobales bacterium]|nr:DinB family protein [Terriglobales bacterium]
MALKHRIADQLTRAFNGDAWHGDSLLEILQGVDAETASAHPIPGAHSIWELVLHIAAWDGAVLRRLHVDVPVELDDDENFPAVTETSEAAWQKAVADATKLHEDLVSDVAKFPEARLTEKIPGKDYDFTNMLLGVVQHELYHAGQIALLKKAK